MTDYTNLRKIVTGDIIVKCRFGTEIRRIPINQVPTYDELCLMMYRVFKKEITTPENIALKYMDNEGDMISLLDDIDITHAISISSLLKVTVHDKSVEKAATTAPQSIPSTQLQASLVELRDNLNALIELFEKEDAKDSTTVTREDSSSNKATRRLTPAELAGFLNDSNAVIKDAVAKASVKELTTLSPKATDFPYYPPPATQSIPQQQKQAPQQQQQQQKPPQQQPQQQPQHTQQVIQQLQQQPPQIQPAHQQQQQQQLQQPQIHQPQLQPIQQQQPQYIQTPPVSSGINQQQQQRPVSMQRFPSQGSQNNAQPSPYVPGTPQQYNSSTNYQPPNNNNDPRLQRQGYYVPPPPSSMSTPQIPPQPYNVPPPPSSRW